MLCKIFLGLISYPEHADHGSWVLQVFMLVLRLLPVFDLKAILQVLADPHLPDNIFV